MGESIDKTLGRHKCHILVFVPRKIDIGDDKPIGTIKTRREPIEELAGTRVLVGLKNDYQFPVSIFFFECSECGGDLIWMMSIVRHEDIAVCGGTDDLTASPRSSIAIEPLDDEVISEPEESPYYKYQACVECDMPSWDLERNWCGFS